VSSEFPSGATDGIRVRFVDSSDGALSVLEIENPVHRQVFSEVRGALLGIGVEVVNIEVRVDQQRMLGRFHLSECDGAPVDRERHLQIQDKILQVVLTQPEQTDGTPRGLKAAAS
jgi:UTP:GlnB (protein PII) uridylyltransferase